MKGGFCGLKGKEISLITIVIMSATIIIWSWEKTPGLTAFLPPQTQLQLSSEEVRTHVIEDEIPSQTDSAQSYSGKNRGESNARTASYKEEILSSVVDEEEQHKEVQEAGKNNGLEHLANSKEIERKRHQPKDEKTSKQGEQTKGSVNFLAEDVRTHVIEDELPSQMDSAQSYSGKNMGESNARTASYKEGGVEILSSVVDEEEQHKEVQEAGKNNGLERLANSKEIERKRHQPKEEKTSKHGEHAKDLVSPMGFQERSSSSSIGGKDKDNHNNVAENKLPFLFALCLQSSLFYCGGVEILSSILDGEVQGKEVLDAGKNNGQESLTSTKDFKRKRPQSRKEKTSKQGEQKRDLISPMDFPERSTSIGGKGKGNHNNVTEDKACNYAKGKWVPDNNRPLYSGFDCKQWLSPMWSCRLTQRTDFAYENLRWQPKDCQMEAFERSKFFRRMQNKTLAFVGDSLGRQQFQSLMCMITGGKGTKNVEDVGKEYGLIVADGAARPNGWAYRFPSTNTTILYYWSAILCDVEPIDTNNPATDHAMHLDRPPSFLRQYIHKFDVLVLNTGHHWNRGKLKANRWVMHVGGVPNTDKKIAVIWGAKNLTINSIVHWVDSHLPKYPGLKAFFTTLSPRHFMGGDWNTGGSCDNTTPMSVGKEILDDESADQIAANAVKGTGVKLLDITALSQIRDEGHISRFSITAQSGVQDCLHWCLPGVPDTWNEILFAQI